MHGREELGVCLPDARMRFVMTMGGFRFCSNLTCISCSSSHQNAIRIFLRKNMAPPCEVEVLIRLPPCEQDDRVVKLQHVPDHVLFAEL